jgi:hypothetical protein
LQVNGTVLEIADAVQLLNLQPRSEFVMRLIDVCLIREELERQQLELSSHDKRTAVGRFRRRRGLRLLTAERARKWMEKREHSDEQLEELACEDAGAHAAASQWKAIRTRPARAESSLPTMPARRIVRPFGAFRRRTCQKLCVNDRGG